MTAAVTKRAVTWLSLPIAVFYFFSVWEHKMVTVQPSMTLQKGLTSRTFTWMWTKLKRRWLISGDRGILTGRSRYMMKRWKQSIGINTSERSLRTPRNGVLTPVPSLRKGTRDSICCGSSDLLTLIQLFLRCFITFIDDILTFSFICWFYNLTFMLDLWQTDLTLSGIYFMGPRTSPVWTVRTLARFRSLAYENNGRGYMYFPTAVRLLNRAWSPIWAVLPILYGFTRVAVWLGLSGVYRSSDTRVCLVDDSSGVFM